MPWRFFWPVTWMALGLVILPSLLWIGNWQWQPSQAGSSLYPWYLITETVTRPWGGLTTVVLFFWFFILLRRAEISCYFGLLLTALVVTAGLFTVKQIKPYVNETRPYRLWLNQQANESIPGQQESIKNATAGQYYDKALAIIPEWQRGHWQRESSYSFPSGHSMFVSCWALLVVALFWHRKYYFSCLIIGMWAMLVIVSRLLLGMHWPWDVSASTAIAWCLVVLVFRFAPQRSDKL